MTPCREYEGGFITLVEKTHARVADTELRSSKVTLEKANLRIAELDTIIKKLYEDNATGRLSNERFDKMFSDYEAEQGQLKKRAVDLSALVDQEKENDANITRFLDLVRKYTDISELTSEITRIFIDKIVVHQGNGHGKTRTQQIDIYYNFIGAFEE